MLTQHLAGEDLEEHGGRARRKRATEEAFLERLWARALTSGVAQQKPITVEFAEPGELGIALESPGQVPPPAPPESRFWARGHTLHTNFYSKTYPDPTAVDTR